MSSSNASYLTHGPLAWDTMKKPARPLSFLKLQTLGKTVNKDHREQLFHVKRIINSSIITRFPRFLANHLFLYSLCSLTRLFKSLKPVGRKQIFTDTSGLPFWAHGAGPWPRSIIQCTWRGEDLGSSASAQEPQVPFGPATKLHCSQCSLLPDLLGPGHPPKSDQGGFL